MTVDELQVLITANTEGLRKEIQNTNKQISGIQSTATKASGSMVGAVLKGTIATQLLSKAISVVTANLDDAISRVDTLNNFPKVMSNLGVSAEDADASMKRLSDALVGLPTTLDDASKSVQRFTSANGNVKASTEMFIALNNAILAGGGSAQTQATALEQLSQAYAKGKPDMMEWRSAMTAMPAQLKQVAMSMGYIDASQLGEALRSGKVSMDEFMVEITKLNKQGVNGFASFEEQARNSTGGIQTAMINVKTAFTRGLAEIINAIGQSNIAGFFQGIAKAINAVVPYITGFVKACVWAVSAISKLFGGGGTKKQVDTTSKSVASLGSSGVSASKGMDKASGSAKKLKKELAGLATFDEMNVLKEQDSSGGGGGGTSSDAGGGSVGNLGDIDLSAFDDMTDELSQSDKIAEKLKGIFAQIGEIMGQIWDSAPVQSFVGFVTTYGQFLFDYWSTLGMDLWNNLSMTWNNIKDDVMGALFNMTELWTIFWNDLSQGIDIWGKPITEKVSKLFNSIWKDLIDPVCRQIAKIWNDLSGTLLKLWEEYGDPLINNIGEFVDTTLGLFQKLWDDVINPIIQPMLEMFSELWDKHLKGVVEELGKFIMKLVNGALEIWNKFVSPILSWLLDKLKPTFEWFGKLISDVFGSLFTEISDVFKNVFKMLGGVVDFITGIFTGNWKKAWEGVKNIFKGIVDGFVAVIKLPINLIIDLLNAFIRGLNHIKIPDWVPSVGGKGFNIKTIPKLATGGVVEKPTLAEIGENGKEVVMPLERNTGWITDLAQKISDAQGNSNGQPYQIVVKVGEDTILDKIVDGINKKSFENNGEVFNV